MADKGEKVEKPWLTAQCTDYCCTGDGLMYDSHSFCISVWSEREQLHFSVQRDYLALCDLHYRLTKKFAHTAFPDLGLEGYKAYVKQVTGTSVASKVMKSLGRRGSVTSSSSAASADVDGGNELRSSILDAGGAEEGEGGRETLPPPKIKISAGSGEMIPQRKNALTEYLQALLLLPEIVMSDDLKLFLDEEAPQGRALVRREISDIDVALVGEDPVTCTVTRDHSFAVGGGASGDMVVWSFATKKKDIGFSVVGTDEGATGRVDEDEGRLLVPYRRYDCHEASVSGCLELVDSAVVTLVWDNSYSKFRTKTLTFVAKLVKKEEFEIYQRIAFEKGRDRQRYEQQRVVLGRATAGAMRTLLYGSGVGMSRLSVKGNGSSAALTSMEEEMVRLREELLEAQSRVTELDSCLAETTATKEVGEESLAEETGLRQASEAREALAMADLADLKTRADGLRIENDTLKQQCLTLEALQREREDELKSSQDKAAEAETVMSDLNTHLTKQRAEKKQLKAYALKLKGKDDERQQEVAALKAHVSSLSETVTNSATDAATAKAAAAAAVADRDALLLSSPSPSLTPAKVGSDGCGDGTLTNTSTPGAGVASDAASPPDNGTLLISTGWSVDAQPAAGFNWASDPSDIVDVSSDVKDELCAFVLARPLSQRLLYLHNSVGF